MFRPRRSLSAKETEDEGEKWSNKYLAETDDVMTEGESGGKLVNKFVKGGDRKQLWRKRGLQFVKELKHLEKVFLANGFPKKLVETNLSTPCVPPTPHSDDDPQKSTTDEQRVLCLPYVRQLSEKLR